MSHVKPALSDWLLLIFLTLMWGFSYYFIKHSLHGFNPTQVASLRMIFSAVVLLPFLGRAYKMIPRTSYPFILLVGVIGSLLPAYLYPFAQQRISSSVAGIVNAFTPICTYGIGIYLFSVSKEKEKIAGSLIALIGAICLILFRPNASLHAESLYLLIAFTVPFLYGFNGNIIKSKLSGIPGIPMTAAMYVSTLIFCIPIAIASGAFQQIPIAIQQGPAFYHLLALSILGSALAMTLFNILIQRVHVLFAASVTYLMPLVSMFIGWLDGEHLLWNDVLGLIFILIGVMTINGAIHFFKKKKAGSRLDGPGLTS